VYSTKSSVFSTVAAASLTRAIAPTTANTVHTTSVHATSSCITTVSRKIGFPALYRNTHGSVQWQYCNYLVEYHVRHSHICLSNFGSGTIVSISFVREETNRDRHTTHFRGTISVTLTIQHSERDRRSTASNDTSFVVIVKSPDDECALTLYGLPMFVLLRLKHFEKHFCM
jgi:hypothetical protein